jgi:adenosine deaminase
MSNIPKVELHCHLDGIVDAEMVEEILQEEPDFPIQPIHLESDHPIHDRDSFFAWWHRIDPIQGSLHFFYPILRKHIQRLKSQNVHYTEITIPTGDMPCSAKNVLDEMSRFRDWATAQEQGEIQVEFLAGLARSKSPQELERLSDCILALYERRLIVGVALAGPEIGHPVRPFERTFARFHAAGLGITIHAGEWCGPESVWDALVHGYANRLGHAVSLFQDERLVEWIQARNIHLELCLTSNLKTGSILQLGDHPLKKALEMNMNFSINTDDPGPLACNLDGEYKLLETDFDCRSVDLIRIYHQSLAARFQPHVRFHVQTGE